MAHKFGVKHPLWKQPQVQMQLNSTGGLMGKHAMPVQAALHPLKQQTFIKLTKSERWLQKAVAGVVQNTCLNSTTLLEQLLEKQVSTGGDELMSGLDYDDDGAGPADHGDGKGPTKNIRMNTIIKVRMPAVCPTAAAHGDGQERVVQLWYRGKRNVWLAREDLEWALSYLRVELDTCGVAPVIDDFSSPSSQRSIESSSQDSEYGQVRWDFSRSAWAYTTLGEKVLYLRPEDLRPEELPAGSQLSYEDKKNVAFDKAKELALATM